MPVELFSDGQAPAYGWFGGVPSQVELERYFFLDDADRLLVAKRRGEHNRLGFAVQLGTVRMLGTFLSDPLDVPWPVVEYLAVQLDVADASVVERYAERLPTQHEHAREIRDVCGTILITDHPAVVVPGLVSMVDAPRALITAWRP